MAATLAPITFSSRVAKSQMWAGTEWQEEPPANRDPGRVRSCQWLEYVVAGLRVASAALVRRSAGDTTS